MYLEFKLYETKKAIDDEIKFIYLIGNSLKNSHKIIKIIKSIDNGTKAKTE